MRAENWGSNLKVRPRDRISRPRQGKSSESRRRDKSQGKGHNPTLQAMGVLLETDKMIAIGNNELEGLPELGETMQCWMCGERHAVEYGEQVHPDGTRTPSQSLAFFKCGDRSYLCGVGGREWRPKGK